MSFQTINELKHFDFTEAHVGNVQVTDGIFHLVLDNVKILPENSCNRDIRVMRCNELLLKIGNPRVQKIVEEGYRQYDANGNLMQEVADTLLEPDNYSKVWEVLLDGELYSLEQTGKQYTFLADGTNERTYMIVVEGTDDSEDWERFLNLE